MQKQFEKGYWKTSLQNFKKEIIPKNLLLDESAQSTDPEKPAFMAHAKDEKVYYGFPLIKEITFDGFCYGAVSDFLEYDCNEGCSIGDGFVEAPDGTRAGLFWELRNELGYSRIREPEANRWGVYYFGIPKPIKTTEDMKETFERMIPVLKKIHMELFN